MHTDKLQEMYGIRMTELELDPHGVVNVLCGFGSSRFTGGRELWSRGRMALFVFYGHAAGQVFWFT